MGVWVMKVKSYNSTPQDPRTLKCGCVLYHMIIDSCLHSVTTTERTIFCHSHNRIVEYAVYCHSHNRIAEYTV